MNVGKRKIVWYKPGNILSNYFWFYTITAVLYVIFPNVSLFNLIFPFIIYYVWIQTKRQINLNGIDFCWMACFVWIIITWLSNSFPHKNYLIFRSFLSSIAFMMAYWIGRKSKFNYLKTIIEKARVPIIISCSIGIYCFLFEPSWYMNIVNNAVSAGANGEYVDKDLVLDQYRLRSFFDGPYPIAYFCSISLIFEFFRIVQSSKITYKKEFTYIAFLLVCVILTMMRAPLACVAIGLALSALYALFFSGNGKFIGLFAGGLIILVGAIYFIKSFVDVSSIQFLLDKFSDLTEDHNNFISGRFFLQSKSFTEFGEGFSKYDAVSFYKFGGDSIPDGEYVKIIAEQGYVGLFLTILLFSLGLLKSIINFKRLYLELAIIIMVLVCMIGADPLTIPDKHCFIYWLALGQISGYNKYK